MSDVKIYDGEAVEPLDDGNVIIQPENGYRFGADAVALSRFACGYVKNNSTVFDMCSGCGIVGISIAIEKGCAVSGAEIDKSLCDMSNRSAEINGLNNVRFVNADIKTLEVKEKYDFVVCNPPFFKSDSAPRKIAPAANSELTVTFDDIAKSAKRILKNNGAFLLVHTSSRLDEILACCRENGLMPKELKMINNGKAFLLKSVLNGKQGMRISI